MPQAPKVGICIEIFFGDLPYAERIRRSAEPGFTAYELWFHDKAFDGTTLTAGMKDFDMLAELNAKHGMTVTDFVFNHPGGGIVASLVDGKDRLECWPTMDHAESLKRTLRYLKG